MSNVLDSYPTEQEIRLVAYQSIQKQLGSVRLIRFIQQLEQGRGDYTKDRYERLGDLSAYELFDATEADG